MDIFSFPSGSKWYKRLITIGWGVYISGPELVNYTKIRHLAARTRLTVAEERTNRVHPNRPPVDPHFPLQFRLAALVTVVLQRHQEMPSFRTNFGITAEPRRYEALQAHAYCTIEESS